jgi:hypothetical protein
VACLLRYFFVGAEIENQEVMGHGSCITKFGGRWLGAAGRRCACGEATANSKAPRMNADEHRERQRDGKHGARLLLRGPNPRGSLSE